MVEVHKQKPMPSGGNFGNNKYPWVSLDIGDAFLPGGKPHSAYQLAKTASGLYAPRAFKAAKADDGNVWIWRVA